MEKEDFLKQISEIGTCENDVERRELLASLQEEVIKDYDTLKTLTETNESLLNERNSLYEANMKMFLRVSADKTADEQHKDETGVKKDEKTKRSFDDLFNEKGEIK